MECLVSVFAVVRVASLATRLYLVASSDATVRPSCLKYMPALGHNVGKRLQKAKVPGDLVAEGMAVVGSTKNAVLGTDPTPVEG